MNRNLPSDYHMHTHNSGDSEAPMKNMIESAIKCGLSEICFTEHMDLDFPIKERALFIQAKISGYNKHQIWYRTWASEPDHRSELPGYQR